MGGRMTICPKCGCEISCMGQTCPGCMTQVACEWCGGKGTLDSGGVTPWGSAIDLPCPHCSSKWDDLVILGASWRKDSSLEKWFPLTAEELAKLKSQAVTDKYIIRRLVEAIDQYLSENGYSAAATILTNARADAVNLK